MNTRVIEDKYPPPQGITSFFESNPKRPLPPQRACKSPWSDTKIVAEINKIVIEALNGDVKLFQVEDNIYPSLQTIELPNPPERKTANIPIDFFTQELEMAEAIEEVRKLLIQAQEYGDDDPSIYAYGSLARTTCARLYALGYKISKGEREFSPDSSDLDIIVPEVLTSDPSMQRRESSMCIPTSSSQTLEELGLIVLKENLRPAVPGPKLDISVLRTSLKSSIHRLNLINYLLPGQPIIKFWLDQDNNIRAEGIVITQTSDFAYNPEIIGMRAFSNAINTIAREIADSNPTDMKIDGKIMSPVLTIFQHRGEKVLVSRFKAWDEAILSKRSHLDTKLRIETRSLALASVNVINNARRNLGIFRQNPEKTIFYLGQSGLLSLILQCALFITPHADDVIEEMCQIFISAINGVNGDTPIGRKLSFPTERGYLYKSFENLRRLMSRLSRRYSTDHQSKLAEDHFSRTQGVIDPDYYKLALEIASIVPTKFSGYLWLPYKPDLQGTYVGANHSGPLYN